MTPHKRTRCSLTISTADGEFLAHYSEQGLCGLEFPSGTRRPGVSGRQSKISPQLKLWHRLAREALEHALAGQPPADLPPLDLSIGTPFQQSVWRALRRIPRGQGRSYAEVARAIGRPKAVRAVGGACGANPVPVLVPCHRVLAAGQRLGGFSGDLNWKRRLLGREGVRFSE